VGSGEGDSSQGAVDVEAVLAEFDSRAEVLESLCEKTSDLLHDLLEDSAVHVQSVQARVKRRKKLREKYLSPAKSYKRLDDITDQAGLRIITYYEDEVDNVAALIEREFDIDRDNTVDKRKIEPDRFGYSAINYVCRHLGTRTSLREYKKFTDLRFEIQVTSILSHAWSEMNHGTYDLGAASPPQVRRRFFQLKALLELAEAVFIELRNKTVDYERSVAVQVEANVPDLPLDAISLRSLLDQEPLIRQIDAAIAAVLGSPATREPGARIGFWAHAANVAGLKTTKDLREALNYYQRAIVEYAELWRPLLASVPEELMRGLSVYQLAMFLIHAAPDDKAAEALGALGMHPSEDRKFGARTEAARKVMRKYPKQRA
jgi:GTP pyrophosphokinase